MDALEKAGFQDIATKDRNEFVCKALRADFELMAGEGREELIRLDRRGYDPGFAPDVEHRAIHRR